MFSDGGKKPEYPERTHAYTGTCKLHTERPQLGFELGDSANHHINVQPNLHSFIRNIFTMLAITELCLKKKMQLYRHPRHKNTASNLNTATLTHISTSVSAWNDITEVLS